VQTETTTLATGLWKGVFRKYWEVFGLWSVERFSLSREKKLTECCCLEITLLPVSVLTKISAIWRIHPCPPSDSAPAPPLAPPPGACWGWWRHCAGRWSTTSLRRRRVATVRVCLPCSVTIDTCRRWSRTYKYVPCALFCCLYTNWIREIFFTLNVMSFISFIFVYYQLSKRNQTWTRRCN